VTAAIGIHPAGRIRIRLERSRFLVSAKALVVDDTRQVVKMSSVASMLSLHIVWG